MPVGHGDCQVPAGTRTESPFGRAERRAVFLTSVVETAERTAPLSCERAVDHHLALPLASSPAIRPGSKRGRL